MAGSGVLVSTEKTLPWTPVCQMKNISQQDPSTGGENLKIIIYQKQWLWCYFHIFQIYRRTILSLLQTTQAFKEVFDRLDSKKEEKDRYRMAKKKQAKTNDMGEVKYIKDKNKNILVPDENIKDWWSAYFDELFNREQGNVVRDKNNHSIKWK